MVVACPEESVVPLDDDSVPQAPDGLPDGGKETASPATGDPDGVSTVAVTVDWAVPLAKTVDGLAETATVLGLEVELPGAV